MRNRLALLVSVFAAASLWLVPGATAATPPSSARFGSTLTAGQQLRSPDGRYLLTVHADGELTVTGHGRTLWHTSAPGSAPRLEVRTDSNLALSSHGRLLWQTNTRRAGTTSLHLTDTGELELSVASGLVWSSTLGNGCSASHGAHRVIVDISVQRARLCAYHQQVLVTPVTTGASSLGDGTPTGTWQVYARVRNTVLYPASGGAYHVHYWMPYDGAYGMHDSPWQHFAYGSSLYRTRGSHGCVHFPARAMKRLFAWAPVGTTVTVHRR